MKLMHSYKVKIINVNDALNDTIIIYRKALSFFVSVINEEWDQLNGLKSKSQVNITEKLTHATKDNPEPLYNFGELFYKYPSYLRRSTISDALGIVSSHKSNLKNWEEEKYKAESNGKKFKKQIPKLNVKHFKCPTLYSGNMYVDLFNNSGATIKIYKKNPKTKKR